MLARVKTDRQGFVAGALCGCGGRLAGKDAAAPGKSTCSGCRGFGYTRRARPGEQAALRATCSPCSGTGLVVTTEYVCERCHAVEPARRVFLAINARVVH